MPSTCSLSSDACAANPGSCATRNMFSKKIEFPKQNTRKRRNKRRNRKTRSRK